MLLGAAGASAQIPGSLENFGGPVAPMFEGWYDNGDGTVDLDVRQKAYTSSISIATNVAVTK